MIVTATIQTILLNHSVDQSTCITASDVNREFVRFRSLASAMTARCAYGVRPE